MEPTDPSDETRRADAADAVAQHRPDREPTDEEERVAEDQGGVDPSVAEHYEEMERLGAEAKGEGRIEQ